MLFGGNGGGSASCSPLQPRRSRRRSRLPLHVGRLRTDVHILERNVFNLLGSLVEETRSKFGVACLLGEQQERGRLPEKIALASLGTVNIPGYRLCNKGTLMKVRRYIQSAVRTR